MPRGGRRTGAPGRAYANRTDLSGKLPITTPTGQPYGIATQQADAQRAVPMATPAVSAAPPAQPAQAAPLPGSFGAFDRPTEHPNEPLTAGLPLGPGPGPEALNLGSQQSLGALLQSLRSSPYASSDVAQLADDFTNR